MKDKRSMIMESFQSLPVTIRRAEDHLDDFPDDQDLQDAATELYIAVLRAIEGMIRWLVGTSTCGLKSIGQLRTQLLIRSRGKNWEHIESIPIRPTIQQGSKRCSRPYGESATSVRQATEPDYCANGRECQEYQIRSGICGYACPEHREHDQSNVPCHHRYAFRLRCNEFENR